LTIYSNSYVISKDLPACKIFLSYKEVIFVIKCFQKFNSGEDFSLQNKMLMHSHICFKSAINIILLCVECDVQCDVIMQLFSHTRDVESNKFHSLIVHTYSAVVICYALYICYLH